MITLKPETPWGEFLPTNMCYLFIYLSIYLFIFVAYICIKYSNWSIALYRRWLKEVPGTNASIPWACRESPDNFYYLFLKRSRILVIWLQNGWENIGASLDTSPTDSYITRFPRMLLSMSTEVSSGFVVFLFSTTLSFRVGKPTHFQT